ncbi:MAG TPA: hypothetical protein VK646_12085 [Actinomycetota bacterium]|nr:hypothetical protein [Actinomycetota bacterium]
MVEVSAAAVGVVLACAGGEALDRLVVPARAAAARLAEDETILRCDAGEAQDIAREVLDRLAATDPDALVRDVSEAWTAAVLRGSDARDAFAFLSALELPDEGFVQGEVVRVPAKVFAERDRIVLLVPAMWEHHLHDRLRRRLAHRGAAT